MENASKALIIAGAILLSILIISLGIMIYNQASGVVNNNAMSEVEITQFNSKFTQYAGSNVRGATVNSMVQAVLTNNVSQDSVDRRIRIDGGTATNGIGGSLEKNDNNLGNISALTGSTYTVSVTYGTTGGNVGLVDVITVRKK